MSDERKVYIDRVRELVREKGEDVWAGGDDNTANILSEPRDLSSPMSDDEARRRMAGMSRRGFLVGGVAAALGILGWRWMSDETKARLLQGSFRLNERISQALYNPRQLAPEFPASRITAERTNGLEGLGEEIDLAAWRLRLGGLPRRTDDLIIALDDVKRLPRTEMITQLKCIEGWSIIVQWAGARFSDLVAAYGPVESRYVSISTPDEKYYVGWDMPSIMHPQTLLAYEMNGRPLTPEHGAPLRIASPTKYGIKQIKRIGRIEFTNERPRDFWAEPENGGYDWYSGH